MPKLIVERLGSFINHIVKYWKFITTSVAPYTVFTSYFLKIKAQILSKSRILFVTKGLGTIYLSLDLKNLTRIIQYLKAQWSLVFKGCLNFNGTTPAILVADKSGRQRGINEFI